VKPTNFRKPRTGEHKLRVQYRCGWISKWDYTADKLRWTDTNHDFDIVAVEMVK
jgi:hypothetical protein